ncbi:hypothetical protein FDP41_006191 [Naegleria fowleri]|uniref:Mitochondrial carrier protein n=1 Tax=Naegleria fowleri TaxID=5763 RepID=A0A6A5BCA0_NAEFO|nr:uncharacterized protein FDP41_006191 [Naegleria fowleri]KAF0974717.1 hypothetical protein FDP41_006191 [Naegleria fowleri]CAG4714169.1 unnamed protein product [Naegleria fowleri]
MIQTKTTTITTRTIDAGTDHPTTATTTTGSTTKTKCTYGKTDSLPKFLKHASIGTVALALSRIALYAPFSVQKTLIAISDTPEREDEEASNAPTCQARLMQYFEKPLLIKLALYQLGHIAVTALLNKQKWVPFSQYKPLEHAVVSASTFPLYYILLDQESRLAVRRGRTLNTIQPENKDAENTLYWQGFALHVLQSFLVHAIGVKVTSMLSTNNTLSNVSDEAVVNTDCSDARARGVFVESVGILVGRLLCLPIEICAKQFLLRSKPKKDSYVSVLAKSALLTVPQVATTLVEYWVYRTLNRLSL